MPADQSDRSKRRGGGPNLLDYAVAYAKQETLDPIVGQFKALGRGIAGAVLMAIGTVLLGVGFVRALQGQFGSSADASRGLPGTAASRALAAGAHAKPGTGVGVGQAAAPFSATTAAASSGGAAAAASATNSGVSNSSNVTFVASGYQAGTSTSLVASSQPSPYGSGHPLSGNWSWVPYMGGALLCLLVAAFCVVRIVKGVPK